MLACGDLLNPLSERVLATVNAFARYKCHRVLTKTAKIIKTHTITIPKNLADQGDCPLRPIGKDDKQELSGYGDDKRPSSTDE